MTDRERQLIEAYLPHPRDPELEFAEYYVLDAKEHVVKAHVCQIAALGTDEETAYQLRTENGRLIHGIHECAPDILGGSWYTKSSLYDNRQDCRDDTHLLYDNWERLRRLQEEEERKNEP